MLGAQPWRLTPYRLVDVAGELLWAGALTTPPCSEGVRWVVMTTPIQLSAEQIGAFAAIIHDNNRPTQPLNGRTVVTEPVVLASR